MTGVAGSWSAPAFFKFHGLGGGLTFGVSRADTVIILNSARALDQYRSPDHDFKFGALLSDLRMDVGIRGFAQYVQLLKMPFVAK